MASAAAAVQLPTTTMAALYGPGVPAGLENACSMALGLHKENLGGQEGRQAGGKRQSTAEHGCCALGSAQKKNRGAFMDVSNESASQDAFFVWDDCCSAAAPPQQQQHQEQQRRASHQQTSSTGRAPFGQALQQKQPARCDWVDIDANNRDNPLVCAEYAAQIFEHLQEAERVRRPDPGYLGRVQSDMTANMRSILVDWLVEVAQEYHLCSDTLHLAINLLDRLLSIAKVSREQLQLAGIACMWVAAKYEEIYAPSARDFCYITDNTYCPAQLVDMEARLLGAVRFEVTVPTAKTFLRRFLLAAAAGERLHYTASFLCEASLLSERLLAFLPSQVAASCVLLSNLMLGLPAWSGTLQHYTGYSPADLHDCAHALLELHRSLAADGAFAAIPDKYADPKLGAVGRLPPLAGDALAATSAQWAPVLGGKHSGPVLLQQPPPPPVVMPASAVAALQQPQHPAAAMLQAAMQQQWGGVPRLG